MYDFILETKVAVFGVALLITFALSLAVGAGRYWWRLFAFDLTLPFAAAFYLVVLVLQERYFRPDTFAAVLFEILVYGLVVRYLVQMKEELEDLSVDSVLTLLRGSVVFYAVLFIPLLFLDGFGVFSSGDRNDYISKYWFAKYLIYGGFLISAAQVPLLASILSVSGKINGYAWAALLMNFVSSVLTGSKGVVFLWLLSIIALMNIEWRKNLMRIFVSGVVIAVLLVVAIYVLATSVDMEPDQLSELLLARFFLSNDARALAYEFTADSTGPGVLLQEAFRGFSPIFGYAPDLVPLGVQLYRDNFGLELDVGANASLVSLVMYYGDAEWRFLYVALMTFFFLAFAFMADYGVSLIRHRAVRLVFLGVFVYIARLYSQDFFAFQSIMIVLAMLGVAFGSVIGVGSLVKRIDARLDKSSVHVA